MPSTPRPEEIQRLLTLFKAADFDRLAPLAEAFSQRHPGHGLGWMLLAAIHKANHRHLDALTAQLRAVEVMPPKAELHSNLGNIQFALGRISDAEASYRQSLLLDPQHLNAHYNYGLLLLKAARPAEAEPHFAQALRLDPGSAEVHWRAALALLEQKQFSKAVRLLQKALELRSGYPEAQDSLSYAWLSMGQVDQAIEAGRAAVNASPQDLDFLANLLFTLNYAQGRAAESLELAKAYGQLVSDRAAQQRFTSWQVTPSPSKLKIGFVSGDFKSHPVSFFLLALLREIDAAGFDCFAYSTTDFEDATSREIQAHMKSWKVLATGSDADAARQIHDDGIHILVDLAGHTGHGRLPVFGFRPAPVQVSWLGYFATTGVAEIDFLLADEAGVPAAGRGALTESVWYLPQTRLCFTAPDEAPDVGPLPALVNGHVTIGCYQSLSKVNDEVLRCWASVFSALPDAKLRWHCPQFADGAALAQTRDRLARHGIAPARTQLAAALSRADYLASHRQVDLILDTFPFPGGTTTCEALWMGVPTLTLAGDSLLSRQGVSLLTAARVADWIAGTPDEYQRKAVAFAGNLEALSALRSRLRATVAASPLFDSVRFARNFEQAMREMWGQCSLSQPPSPP